jgi:hypothetical protein
VPDETGNSKSRQTVPCLCLANVELKLFACRLIKKNSE